MSISLGSGWLTPELDEHDEQMHHAPTIEDLRSEQLLIALSNLQDALNSMPAPVINVAEPDLTAIVQAVTQLKGPASAQEIAQAVREVIDPSPQATVEPVLVELTQALKKLDFRMTGWAASGTGGTPFTGSIDVSNRAERQLGAVTATVTDSRGLTERMFAKAPASGYSLWLDTADVSYIYMAEGTLGAAGTDAVFRGIRVTKDASGNPLGEVQQATDFAWDSRAAAGWA